MQESSVSTPPSFRAVPDFSNDYGEEAFSLAKAYGLALDDWQRDIVRSWLGCSDDGKYAARTCGVVVPRQNGKNSCIEVRELFGAAILGEKILHTAHEVKTCMKAFSRLKEFFGEKANDPNARYKELNALVKRVSNTNGREAIELVNGGSIEFSARSRGAARGFTVDVTIYDEAQELTDEQLEASMPAKSAAPLGNPQTIYTGTPPNGQGAVVFGRVRKNAKSGAERMAWHEWCVSEIGDVSDRARWFAVNPAMPHRISEETVQDELANMSPYGFAVERLCFWPDDVREDTPISAKDWERCQGAPHGGVMCISVKFDPRTHVGSACAAFKDESGVFLEFIESEPMEYGLDWAVRLCSAQVGECAEFVLDGGGDAMDLRERLLRSGIPPRKLRKLRTSDITKACSMLVNAVNDCSVSHMGQEELTSAACESIRRKVGASGWGFDSAGCGEGTIIEAAALAYMACMTTTINPKRKMRIG